MQGTLESGIEATTLPFEPVALPKAKARAAEPRPPAATAGRDRSAATPEQAAPRDSGAQGDTISAHWSTQQPTRPPATAPCGETWTESKSTSSLASSLRWCDTDARRRNSKILRIFNG